MSPSELSFRSLDERHCVDTHCIFIEASHGLGPQLWWACWTWKSILRCCVPACCCKPCSSCRHDWDVLHDTTRSLMSCAGFICSRILPPLLHFSILLQLEQAENFPTELLCRWKMQILQNWRTWSDKVKMKAFHFIEMMHFNLVETKCFKVIWTRAPRVTLWPRELMWFWTYKQGNIGY